MPPKFLGSLTVPALEGLVPMTRSAAVVKSLVTSRVPLKEAAVPAIKKLVVDDAQAATANTPTHLMLKSVVALEVFRPMSLPDPYCAASVAPVA